MAGFETFGLSPAVYRGVKRMGYRVPTPIQRKTIQHIMRGSDVVATARTGSGKTAAFLVPMLQKLAEHVPQAGVRALILSPTRDLALQTSVFAEKLGKLTDLRISVLVGGDSMEGQFEDLAQKPDIIIATPGRLMHHLSEVDDMSLHTVEYVVFDEADTLFSMGFAKQLHTILTQLSENRQTLLFSATIPTALAEFTKAGLRDPITVRIDSESRITSDLKLTFFTVRHEEKCAALLYLIREQIRTDEQSLIFVSTNHHAEFLNALFRKEGIEPLTCYGKMDDDARKINLSKFRHRKSMLMIVTDIAAKGMDIPFLDNVINWDFPPEPKLFVHRVGRVARAGRTGTAYSFLTSEDMPYLLDLHLFLSKPVKAAPTEENAIQDMEKVMSEIDEAMTNGCTIYGSFPQRVLDLVSDRIRQVIDSSAELTSLQKAFENAVRLFNKIKPMPSSESIRRAKGLPSEGLHPIFKSLLGQNELAALAFSEQLKAFRPKKTILETEGANARSKHMQGSPCQDVMKKKRAMHEGIINKVHHERRSDNHVEEEVIPDATTCQRGKRKKVSGAKRKATTFKDNEYFITAVPPNQHMEAGLSVRGNEGFESDRLKAAVLDLAADDTEGLLKQKAKFHWDKRSKKYIKLNNGDCVTASGKIKTESGAIVKSNKTGIYKKWKERSHNKVTLGRGTGGEDNTEPGTRFGGTNNYRGDNRRFKGGSSRKNMQNIPNAHVRSELKSRDQISKERLEKATRVSQLRSKSNSKRGKKAKRQ